VTKPRDIDHDYAGKYRRPWISILPDKSVSFTDVIKALEDAETDDDIKGYL
jgi:protease-4